MKTKLKKLSWVYFHERLAVEKGNVCLRTVSDPHSGIMGKTEIIHFAFHDIQ